MTRNLKRRVTAAAAVLAAGAAAWPAVAVPSSNPPPKPVVVTNTIEQKLPVLIDQIVQVAGIVGIDPTANTVKLDPDHNRVKLAPLERVQAQLSLNLPDNDPDGLYHVLAVPQGKRFIADFVDIRGECPDITSPVDPYYWTELQGTGNTRFDPPLDILKISESRLLFRYAGPAGFWANPGEVVWQPRSTPTKCAWTLILSGHYEPLS